MNDKRNNQIISINSYSENDPLYKEIRLNLLDKLNKTYEEENFEEIINYVMKIIFIQKKTFEKCVEECKACFKDKAEEFISFIWDRCHQIENKNNVQFQDKNKKTYFNKKYNAKQSEDYEKQYKNIKNKFDKVEYENQYKNTRERSRDKSDDNDSVKKKTKGYYPPKRPEENYFGYQRGYYVTPQVMVMPQR